MAELMLRVASSILLTVADFVGRKATACKRRHRRRIQSMYEEMEYPGKGLGRQSENAWSSRRDALIFKQY